MENSEAQDAEGLKNSHCRAVSFSPASTGHMREQLWNKLLEDNADRRSTKSTPTAQTSGTLGVAWDFSRTSIEDTLQRYSPMEKLQTALVSAMILRMIGMMPFKSLSFSIS